MDQNYMISFGYILDLLGGCCHFWPAWKMCMGSWMHGLRQGWLWRDSLWNNPFQLAASVNKLWTRTGWRATGSLQHFEFLLCLHPEVGPIQNGGASNQKKAVHRTFAKVPHLHLHTCLDLTTQQCQLLNWFDNKNIFVNWPEVGGKVQHQIWLHFWGALSASCQRNAWSSYASGNCSVTWQRSMNWFLL